MRLTTKFSAFVTLLIGLTIFVTLIGSSLSFYNGIQQKSDSRIRAVATIIDSRLINTPFAQLDSEMDEMMVPVDIVSIRCVVNGKPVFSHTRRTSYQPVGKQLPLSRAERGVYPQSRNDHRTALSRSDG